MRRVRRALRTGLAAAAIAAALASAYAQPSSLRIVAIGDVHGSADGFRAILRASGLIGASDQWTGGNATLVQTGDVTDRGAEVRGALDLLRRLSDEAPQRGGRVVALLGNHEVMNLVGDLRDVTPEICSRFAGDDADAVQQAAWRDYETLVRDRARRRPGEQPAGLTRTADTFLKAYPRGCVEYRRAMGPRGDYGRWLRRLPIAARVGRTVFMHAGAPPATTASLDETVTQAKQEIERYDRFIDRLVRARLAQPWFRFEDVLGVAAAEVRWLNALAEKAKLEGTAPDLSDVDVSLAKEAIDVLGMGTWSLLAPEGPLWYRGHAMEEDVALDAPLSAFLQRWGADRMVVAHTVQRDAKIRARLAGRLFLIDTGMLAAVYKGTGSALEITGTGVHAIYADGTRVDLAAGVKTP